MQPERAALRIQRARETGTNSAQSRYRQQIRGFKKPEPPSLLDNITESFFRNANRIAAPKEIILRTGDQETEISLALSIKKISAIEIEAKLVISLKEEVRIDRYEILVLVKLPGGHAPSGVSAGP